ncbi:uncharacterized protein LOC100889842 isoform X6 [Strongylocentrotus purpuratus]|uniref:SRCR domain-containing protein n=1 Tax=Strongylocentrotus purpuratus TaxID=7668 RepID=A0A7M7NN53_STRPU|nr:uncharacterized protein LOC100889842 isoform X6 [Strongylocentrotus purpuratus]
MAERCPRTIMNFFLQLSVIICGLAVLTHAADGDVKLRGGAANSGRVEVEYNKIYGTVCIDGFDIENADVVCKQLGFRDGALKVGAVDDFSFASGASLDIVLFNANCVGDETNIASCPDVTWSGGTCLSNKPAAVFCALPYYEGCYESSTPVGYTDNSQTLHGFVEICRVFQYAYAGSSQVSGDKNRCGNDLSEFGTLVDDSLCAEVCGNDPYQLCGGTGDYRAVYSTRLGSEGFTLTGASGSLTSFNYPGVYMSNERQEWTVTLGSTERVQITFPAFDINSGNIITISAGGMNETFTSRRTWITDPISSFTVWFESPSSGNGFILNYDVYIISAATTVLPAQSTAQDTTTIQPPATSDVVATTPPSLDTTTSDSTATDPVTQGGTPSQPPPQPVVTTMRQATTADEMATPASNGTCPESVGDIERQLSRDVSDLLVINTGRPLPCHGAITRISFYAATTNQINVTLWRRASGNALQLIDMTQLTPARSVTFVSALLPRSLGFAQGDFVGFSSDDLSPLVYSESASEATEHEVHSFSNLGNYPELHYGMNLEVTNSSEVIVSNRVYSWKITIEDRQCIYPRLSNGAIAPAGTSAFVNDQITITCDAGFAAAFDRAVCQANGTFTNPIQCNKLFDGLTFTQFVILLVGVGTLFLLVIFSLCCYVLCGGSSKHAKAERDIADGAPGSGGDSYLLPMTTPPMNGHEKKNGIENTSFVNEVPRDIENGNVAPVDPNMNGMIEIDMSEEEVPQQVPDSNPSAIPETPSEPMVPAVETPNGPGEQMTTPEIPEPDYDDEAIPPPPSSPPPPPPPEFDDSAFMPQSPTFPPLPTPVRMQYEENPVDDSNAEQPSSVLQNEEVLY